MHERCRSSDACHLPLRQACPQKLGPAEELAPPEALLEQRDKERPFSIKHARQQVTAVAAVRAEKTAQLGESSVIACIRSAPKLCSAVTTH